VRASTSPLPPASSISNHNPRLGALSLEVRSESLEAGLGDLSIASPSSASSGSGSSASPDITVDGGFTDYLSDEDEAELQRLAEDHAALVAQTIT